MSKKTEFSELFLELKKEYLQSFDEKISSLMMFWHRRDLKNLQNEFHKIKGTGKTYGVHEATQVAEILEDLCATNSPFLGASIMIALETLRHIRHQHFEGRTLQLEKDELFKKLKHYQKTNKSA